VQLLNLVKKFHQGSKNILPLQRMTQFRWDSRKLSPGLKSLKPGFQMRCELFKNLLYMCFKVRKDERIIIS